MRKRFVHLSAMGTVAADDVAQIKEGEALVDTANKKLNALKQKVRFWIYLQNERNVKFQTRESDRN